MAVVSEEELMGVHAIFFIFDASLIPFCCAMKHLLLEIGATVGLVDRYLEVRNLVTLFLCARYFLHIVYRAMLRIACTTLMGGV